MIRILKLGDHVGFAVGNFLLAGYISKNFGEIFFGYYVLGLTIALFFYGFFRISFINKIYVDLAVGENKNVASMLFVIISLFGGGFLFLSELQPYFNVGLFFCIIFLVYFQIDYFRAGFQIASKVFKSTLPSVFFLLSVLLFYIFGYFYQYIFLYLLIVFLLSLKECLVNNVFVNKYIAFWFKIAFKNVSVYWLLNSACSHLPVIFLAGKSGLLVGGFYALRSLLGTSSMIIRSLEIDLRLNITKVEGGSKGAISEFFLKCFFIISICSFLIFIFFDFVFLKIYGTGFEMNRKAVFFFGLYMFSCWIPLVVEIICLRFSDNKVLSKIRALDLMFFLIVCTSFFYSVNSVETFVILCSFGNLSSALYLIVFLNKKSKAAGG